MASASRLLYIYIYTAANVCGMEGLRAAGQDSVGRRRRGKRGNFGIKSAKASLAMEFSIMTWGGLQRLSWKCQDLFSTNH